MVNTYFKKVARCKLCNGILVSEQSIKRGYGPSCYRKRDEGSEYKEDKDVQITGQVTIFDILGE